MYGFIKDDKFYISDKQKEGYKEIILAEEPIRDGQHFYTPYYEDNGINIVEKWKPIKKQPPTEQERMQAQIDDLNLIIADLLGGMI